MDKGAHFHSCDFQVHSPLDGRWKGQGNAGEDDRRQYAKKLVDACRSAGLQAVAITDHHEMGFIQLIRQAALSERGSDGRALDSHEHLTVFPGMELTLGVHCQALLIFDADFPDDLFSLARTALAIQENMGGTVVRLDPSKEELDKHSYLRGRYTVFPIVSDGGPSTLLRTGQAGKYNEMPCVGGYVDGGIEKLGDGNRSILAGKDQKPHRCDSNVG
jgi:hypothetical protein